MNFNAPLLKSLRILLFPFSLCFAGIVIVRNWLFDRDILRSASFHFPVICIGNLSLGGTGKSTMVEYLIKHFKSEFRMAVLSRGYKRKTKGYAVANEKSTALEIGDEPMQFHLKFPDVVVAVGEERLVAIPQLLQDHPDRQLILLDDAFQHRSVRAGLNILLTEYDNLYTRDWYVPTGDLRDSPSSYRRCQIMVVTKCPTRMAQADRKRITDEMRPLEGQSLFFSAIRYGQPYHILTHQQRPLTPKTEVLLVSGIANPLPLKKYLLDHAPSYDELMFNDHHIFTIDDWKEIRARFDRMAATDKIILTTEKDAVRLIKFAGALGNYPLFVIPVDMQFLFGQEEEFLARVRAYVHQYHHTLKPN